jgi:hypothetical protein
LLEGIKTVLVELKQRALRFVYQYTHLVMLLEVQASSAAILSRYKMLRSASKYHGTLGKRVCTVQLMMIPHGRLRLRRLDAARSAAPLETIMVRFAIRQHEY